MPKKCFVYGCSSGYRKSEKVPMFKVPKDDTLFLFIKWKKAAKRGRSDKTLSRNDHICSKHFLEQDIIKGETDFNGVYTPRKKWWLTKGAIPVLGKGNNTISF
jgi:hypothetical protein